MIGQSTLSKSGDEVELGGAVERPGGCAAIQKDPDRLEKTDGQVSREIQQGELQTPALGKHH